MSINTNIYVIPCKQGQKRDGVEQGGLYICKELNLKYNLIKYDNRKNILNNFEYLYDYVTKYVLNKSKQINNLFIGGDHSVTFPIISAYLDKYGSDDFYLIYIDAHGDINSPKSSKSGNYHGMPVNYILGFSEINKKKRCLDKSHLFYVGLDDVEPQEWDIIKKENINFNMKLNSIYKTIYNKSKNPLIYISLDVDAISSDYLDSTGYPGKNRLNPHEIISIINKFKTNLIGIDIMEFNPLLGNKIKSLETIKTILENYFNK